MSTHVFEVPQQRRIARAVQSIFRLTIGLNAVNTVQGNMDKDSQVEEAKQLICQMCLNFYQQGWVGGTGGGMSIKTDKQIVMAPSGVQKERMVPEDMFVLDHAGNVTETPTARPAPYKAPKLSECSPLFMAVRFSLSMSDAHVQPHHCTGIAYRLTSSETLGRWCIRTR